MTIDGMTVMVPVHTAPAFESPYVVEQPDALGRSRISRDGIPLGELARAYADHLGRLFLHESDLSLRPPKLLLRLFGLATEDLIAAEDLSAVSVEAAEAAADRDRVEVSAL